jgi:hypothetical protein
MRFHWQVHPKATRSVLSATGAQTFFGQTAIEESEEPVQSQHE